ncbi:MAG: sugar ABC transporter permease [Clostridiales bacterium]|nr:sugar ABC transporter permease [Clostridiales bacterium]
MEKKEKRKSSVGTRALKLELKHSVFLIPCVAIIVIFFLVPIVMAVYYSFTNLALSGVNAKNFMFVGLKNYVNMWKDKTVLISIWNTVVFLIGSLIGQQVLGFIIALCMKGKNSIFRRIVGPIFLAGWIVPEVVVAICCTTTFSNDGTINAFLGIFGIPMIRFLQKLPMVTVILANVWHGTAFSMLNFQSALDSVSGDIEEAAKVDGANYFQTVVRIIVPCIRGTIATNTMLNTLSTLGVFGLIYMMTGGGPSTSTTTLTIYMYKQAFVSQQLGYGTAIAMLLLVIGIICSVIYTRMDE